MTVLALFGGLALLLYGMQLTGEGLQRAAGGHLRHLLTSMTRNRLAAVGAGAAVGGPHHAPSAETLLGADIGTPFTVQLLAFKIQELALLLVGVGFAMSFFARRGMAKNLGQAILGFGFLFLGMRGIAEGIAPLAGQDLSRQVLVAFAANPVLGILAGAFLSATMASSAATIGLALSLASQGLLGLSGAVPIVLGANIGTCATAFAASLRSSSDARRVAVADIAFKVLVVG